MNFNLRKDIKFSYFYKKFNILSLILIIFSILALLFKGLNMGVDFKGGTLIELRVENQIKIFLYPLEKLKNSNLPMIIISNLKENITTT